MRLLIRALQLTLILITATSAQNTLVTVASDAGVGSLRAAVSSTVDGGNIIFDSGLSGQTIQLTTGEIVIDKELTINASSLSKSIVVSGGNLSRVVRVTSAGALTIQDLTIQDGQVEGASSEGGGILVESSGSLTIESCTISDCKAQTGGAICNEGFLDLTNTTLANNHATASGGSICTRTPGGATLTQCTISNNTAITSRGGIAFISGTLHLENSIVAGNSAPTDPNIGGSPTTTAGTNLVSGNPNLAPLSEYGGPTMTMLPLAGSPAIDAAGTSNPGGTDQRGFPRFVGAQLDIGAVELGPVTVVDSASDDADTSTTLRKAIADAAGCFRSSDSLRLQSVWRIHLARRRAYQYSSHCQRASRSTPTISRRIFLSTAASSTTTS